MDSALPSATPFLLGPPSDAQFCPNPACRRPFGADQLDDIAKHFEPRALCGIWLATIQSTHTVDDSCPNPICRKDFESPEEAEEHLSSTPCGDWYRNIQSGRFPAYPQTGSYSFNDGVSCVRGSEERD